MQVGMYSCNETVDLILSSLEKLNMQETLTSPIVQWETSIPVP